MDLSFVKLQIFYPTSIIITQEKGVHQGIEIRTVHWTLKKRGLRFLKSNRDDVIINLIIN